MKRTHVRPNGSEHRYRWAYVLRMWPSEFWAFEGRGTWAEHWRQHRDDVGFVLGTVKLAYSHRHDLALRRFALAALRSQRAALRVFDPDRADFGADAFPLAFACVQRDLNALGAEYLRLAPHRAAAHRRKGGDETRDEVRRAVDHDKLNGGADRGRLGRIAHKLRMPISTVRSALKSG